MVTATIGGGNDGTGTSEGCLEGRIVGTYVHGPLLPKNVWLADQLLAWACEHRGLPTTLAPLDDQLEDVAAAAASVLARSERR